MRTRSHIPIRSRHRTGFSLVEVLIAVALLSTVLVTLMLKVHDCIDTARVTEFQNASREYSKELMAQIEAGTIDGLVDGYQGDFTENHYPQIRYTIGIGENSQVTQATNSDNPNFDRDPRRPYTHKGQDGSWLSDNNRNLPSTSGVNGTNPDGTTSEDEAEEPYTRVRIVVQFPTAKEDSFGTFTLERMIATECTRGASGLKEKAQKDAEAAGNESAAGAAAGGSGTGETGKSSGGTSKGSKNIPSGSGTSLK